MITRAAMTALASLAALAELAILVLSAPASAQTVQFLTHF